MGLTPDVAAGNLIQSSWGNEVRDRTVQHFATAAELIASWPDADKGAVAITTDTNSTWIYSGTAWQTLVPTLQTMTFAVTFAGGVQTRDVVYPQAYPAGWIVVPVAIVTNAVTGTAPALISVIGTGIDRVTIRASTPANDTYSGVLGANHLTVAGWPPGSAGAGSLWRYAAGPV